MGIRVHKAIGYGVDDIVVQEDDVSRIIDPRIYGDRWQEVQDSVQALSKEEAQKIIRKERDLIAFLYRMAGLEKTIQAQVDFSMEGLEIEYAAHKKSKSRTPFCIYEFEALPKVMLFIPSFMPIWYRFDDSMDWVDETNSHDQKDRYVKLERPPYPYDSWAHEGKVSFRHREGATPYVPPGALASLVLHKEAFIDLEEFVGQLRPLHYVWWA